MNDQHPARVGDDQLGWRADRAFLVSDDDREVWSFGGAGPVRLAGSGAGPLARAIDGGGTAAHVLGDAVAAGMTAVDAERILAKWLDKGHVRRVTPEPNPPTVTISPGASEDPADDAALGSDRQLLAGALAALGLQVRDEPPATGDRSAAIGVVLVTDLLSLSAARWCGAPAAPWMAVSLRGDRALVTSWLDGTRGRCPDCLTARLRLRRTPEVVAAQRVGRAWPPVSPVRHRAAVALAAGVIAAMADPGAEPPGPELTVIDPGSGQVRRHRVQPVAGCATCDPGGSTVVASHLHPAGARGPAPGDGGSRVLGERGGGGFRVVDPDETWQRYSPLISDVVGVVPYVRRSGPADLRAFVAGPNVAAADDLVMMRSRLRSASGGKGISVSAARTGALAEALERHSLRATGGEPCLRAHLDDLPGPAVLPNDIQLFSATQLRRAEQLAALDIEQPSDAKGWHRVPRTFDPAAVHDWSPVVEWRTGTTVWLPSSMVWFGWPGQPPGYPSGSSNGAAAGNTVIEALLQGLLELVERDSVALWWHPRCRRPAFDLAAWDDPRIDSALAAQRALGSDVWVLDVTSDLGIPAAVAVATGWTPATQAPLLGFGAHLDPALAVVRALTELAQMQAPVVASQGQILHADPGTADASWFADVTVESEPWLAPHGVAPIPGTPSYGSVDEAVEDAIDRLTDRGLRVLWADCTRPDIGLPVVRTWAPGLRHFWNRYAPGRLYDVPPSLGWCQPGYAEADLNPWPMIL